MTESTRPRVSVPRLEGWVSFDEFAEMIRVSKQAVHKMLEAGHIQTARSVGRKSIYVLSEDEALAIKAIRDEAIKVAAGSEPPVTALAEDTMGAVSEAGGRLYAETSDPAKPILVDVL